MLPLLRDSLYSKEPGSKSFALQLTLVLYRKALLQVPLANTFRATTGLPGPKADQQASVSKPFAIAMRKCERPPAKAGGFGLRLKAGLIGHSAD
jgi:hypothetical protein